VFPYYVLHVGAYYQQMTTTNYRKRLLIHELTHVWQGQHGVPLGYVLNSAVHQTLTGITNGGDVAPAYNYSTGLKWAQYNCEQQASSWRTGLSADRKARTRGTFTSPAIFGPATPRLDAGAPSNYSMRAS